MYICEVCKKHITEDLYVTYKFFNGVDLVYKRCHYDCFDYELQESEWMRELHRRD